MRCSSSKDDNSPNRIIVIFFILSKSGSSAILLLVFFFFFFFYRRWDWWWAGWEQCEDEEGGGGRRRWRRKWRCEKCETREWSNLTKKSLQTYREMLRTVRGDCNAMEAWMWMWYNETDHRTSQRKWNRQNMKNVKNVVTKKHFNRMAQIDKDCGCVCGYGYEGYEQWAVCKAHDTRPVLQGWGWQKTEAQPDCLCLLLPLTAVALIAVSLVGCAFLLCYWAFDGVVVFFI